MEIGSLDFKIAMDSSDVDKQLQKMMDTLKAFDTQISQQLGNVQNGANQTTAAMQKTANQAGNLKQKHKEMTDEMHSGISSITDDYNTLNGILARLKSIGGIAIGGYALGETVNKVIQTRGEFQQLEIAFETMLGSGEKAADLMSQITHTAAVTPFDLKGVADGAKQLLAYGVSLDEVNEKIVQLGDIAAGMSLPLSDLVYLYGTTMTQGRMFTMDLRQFQGRGIPLAEELAKIFHTTTKEVGELVSKGKVTSKEFKKAIENMASAGGKFNNLMEKQSKSLTGQLSNLEDAVDVMYNDIGKAGEEIFAKVIEKISWLVENYKQVGAAILEVIEVYGVYKGTLLAINVAHKAAITYQKAYAAAQLMSASAGKTLTTSQLAANASMITLNKGVKALTASLKASSLAALANPYVLLAAAITAVGYAIYKVVTYEDEFQKAHRRLQEAVTKNNAEMFEERAKISELVETIKTAKEGTDQYANAKKELLDVAKKYGVEIKNENGELDLSIEKYTSLQEAVKQYYAERGKQAFIAAEKENMIKGITASVQKFIAEAEEEIINDNKDNLSDEEIGKRKAQIAKAAFDLQEMLMKGQIAWEKKDGEIKLRIGFTDENGDSFNGELPKNVQAIFDMYHKELHGLEITANKWSGDVDADVAGWYRLENIIMDSAKAAKASVAAMGQAGEAFGAIGTTPTKEEEKKSKPKEEKEKESEKERKKREAEEKRRAKAADAALQAEQRAAEKRKALEQRNQDNEFAATDDSYQARIDKLKADNDRVVAAINKTADDYVKASVTAAKKRAEANGKKLSDKEIKEAEEKARKEITELQTKAIETQGDVQDRQENSILQDSIQRYIDYYKQKLDLEKQYQEDLKAAKSQEEKDVIEANKKNADENIDLQMQKEYNVDGFNEFAEKIQNMGFKQLSAEIDKTQKALSKLNKEAGGKFSKKLSPQIAELNAKLSIANANFTKLTEKQKQNRETLAEVGKYWNNLSGELKDVASQFRNVGEEWSDTMANVLDTAAIVGDSVLTIINGIVQLTQISSMSIQTTSETASTAIKAMETASVILAIISAAMQIAMKMVEIFSNEKKVSQEEIEMYHNQMEALDDLIDKQQELLESTSALNAELYGQNLKQTYEKEIKATEQIALKYAGEHGRGEHSLDKELSTAKSKYGVNNKTDLYNKNYAGYTNQQMEDATNSAAGIISWVKQMSAEEYADFRTTRFFAELTSKNKNFAESLDTINEKVQDIANVDEIKVKVSTQTDLDEVAEDLTDLATNAETTAEDIGDTFESTMHKAMKAILKDKILAKGLDEWYDQFYDAIQDGELTEGETNDLREGYNRKVEEAQNMWKKMNEVAGIDISGEKDEDTTTLSGALANASQESIDLLAGQTNAVRVNQISMMDIMKQQLIATVSIQESTANINMIVQNGFDKLLNKLSEKPDYRAAGGI